MSTALFGALVCAVVFAACGSSDDGDASNDGAAGLGKTVRQGGPQVVWDFDHRPLPDIPLPNNEITLPDNSSPTGRRLIVSLTAATRYETRTRRLFNKLDGFGGYAPITFRFTERLDLADIKARHANDDFRDDAFFLLNVDRSCRRFGEEVALDVGRGRFPITLMSRSRRIADAAAPYGFTLDEGRNPLFEHDPQGDSLNLLFPDFTEDQNRNGVLDAGEDLNENDRLDEANFIDPHACNQHPATSTEHSKCVAENLLTWYERETDTLILRPVWPLEERCTYAMVLTKRLRGADGNPVESPFDEVQPQAQIEAVLPVADFLSRYGLEKEDIAFAWSFGVGTMTKDLEQIRAGLYGSGALARLAGEFPVSNLDVFTRNQWRAIGNDPALPPQQGGDDRLIGGGCATQAYAQLAGNFDGDQQVCGGYADFAAVGGFFGGTFDAPNLLVDRGDDATAKYPADEDETWDLDAEAGRAVYGTTKVTFYCALPREEAKPANITCTPGNPEGTPWCKPYPFVFYAHGYGGSKAEFLLHVGRHAQMGMAGCGIDSFGHGLRSALEPGCPGGAEFQLAKLQLGRFNVPEVANMVLYGRDRDLNNDGCPDSGGDQWTANLFHTRDIVRQSVLEEIQFVRIMRAVDGTTKDRHGNVLGDVDGDGEPDIGGRRAIGAAWGISLGGQLMGVLAGAEPTLDVVSPNAVGAGLTDISVRLGQGGLAEAVMLPVMGPILVGCLPTDEHQNPLSTGSSGSSCLPQAGDQPEAARGAQPAGELHLAWYAHDTARFRAKAFARVSGIVAGDTITLENLDKDLSVTRKIGRRGSARLQIAADAMSPINRRREFGLGDNDRGPTVAPDVTRIGDRVRITLRDAAGNTKSVIDKWQWDVTFQGTIYPAGQPLVVLQEGLGYARNTPEFRRFYGIAQHGVAPADPAVWSERYFDQPIEATYDPAWWRGRSHVLVMPTIGDPQVPIATGVSLGRTSGLLGSWKRDPQRYRAEHGWRELFAPDARYGRSVEQWLIDNHVVEGDWRMERWANSGPNPHVLFDPDNISDGAAEFSCLHSYDWSADNGEFRCPPEIDNTDTLFQVPHGTPAQSLRQDHRRSDGSFDALRIPLLRPAGQHGIYNPQPFRAFDADAFMVNFTARYMATRAQDVSHEAGCDCTFVERPGHFYRGRQIWPGVEDARVCPDSDMTFGKRCSAECASGWGLALIPPTACDP